MRGPLGGECSPLGLGVPSGGVPLGVACLPCCSNLAGFVLASVSPRAKKLQAAAQKEGLSDDEIQKIGDHLNTGFSRLMKLAQPTGDIVDVSIARWNKSRKDKRREVLRQSLQSTLDLQSAE